MRLTYVVPARYVRDGDLLIVQWKPTELQREHLAAGQPFSLMVAARDDLRVHINVEGRE